MPFNDVITRIGLLGTTLLLFNMASSVATEGELMIRPLSFVLSVVGWGLAMLMGFMALTTTLPRRAVWIILGAMLFSVVCSAYINSVTYTPNDFSTDNSKIVEYSLHVLKAGKNPYAWDYTDAFRVYRNLAGITFWTDGSYQHRLTYPILPTLLLWVYDLVGLGQTAIVGVSFFMLLVVLLFTQTTQLRPLILLPLFIIAEFSGGSLVGILDIVTSTLIVGMILAWKRPVLRAVLFGLACSFRQQPWFVAPFLLITLWYEGGAIPIRWRRIALFIGVSVGVFVTLNLPFFLMSPVDFLRGAFEPLYALFDVHGVGLNAIWAFGLLPLSREFFTLLQFTTYLALLLLHWRHPRSVGFAFWMFPALFMWVYYRSLMNYWIYWIPPLLFVAARYLDGISFVQIAPDAVPPRRARLTGFLLVPLLGVNLVYGAFLVVQRAPLNAQVLVPLRTSLYWADPVLISQMTVQVTNTSNQLFSPRFAIRRDNVDAATPWTIRSGPETLNPGESSLYEIDANGVTSRMLLAGQGGQLVVGDANGNYQLRVVVKLTGDPTFTDPDLIQNPDFHLWDEGATFPLKWEGTDTLFHMEVSEGRNVLVMQPTREDGAAVRLSQVITFPAAMTVWVHPLQPQAIYGFEIDDGERILQIIFGERGGLEKTDDTHAVLYITAPLNVWSQQTFDSTAIYQQLNWPLPPFSTRVKLGMDFAARQATFSLITDKDAVFGSIEQSTTFVRPEGLVNDALQHPDIYFVNVGDDYRRQRNYDLAIESYQRALTYNPNNPDAYFGIGESNFWLDEFPASAEAFQQALTAGYYQPGMAYKGMAHALYSLEQYAPAAEAFQNSINAFADKRDVLAIHRADAYAGLGWSDVKIGDCTGALAAFNQALTYNPDPALVETIQQGITQCGQ